jgi:mannose-1-phosphate guanylyltransferase
MLYALLMAGGSGTRFWPESRAKMPKQLINIVDDRTMIQATVRRIASLIPHGRIMVVCGLPHQQEIRRQLPSIPDNMIVAEPKALNTAPCIALAACKLLKRDPKAIMAVLPSDHTIGNVGRFLNILNAAHTVAAKGEALITFGIVPDRPETGYGYIECGELLEKADSQPVYRVNRFVEKPDLQRAMGYVKEGNYLWNSGMFVWKASAIMEAFKIHLPRIAAAADKMLTALNGPSEEEAVRDAYEDMDSVSIDYGILEKADNVLVMPADVQWNDVGSWNALKKVWENDPDGNAFRGKLLSVQSRDCIVSSKHKLTTLIGVEDLIIVDTPDALMVCRKDRAQDVKILQGILKDQGHEGLL